MRHEIVLAPEAVEPLRRGVAWAINVLAVVEKASASEWLEGLGEFE